MQNENRAWWAGLPGIVSAMAAAQLALHLGVAHRYDYFRDELYYIACGRHLDWGYVDQPPVIVCYGLKAEVQKIWPRLKHWD